MSCSTQVRAARDSEAYIVILEVACFFENQSMGVLLRTRGISVTGLPVVYNDKDWHQRSVS